MTTAHRPTWKAAYGLSDSVGKGYVPTRSYSARVYFYNNIGFTWIFEIKVKAMGTRLSLRVEVERF